MSLTMELGALGDMWNYKWQQWMPLAVFSVDVDVAFACHSVATPILHPNGIGYASKN